MKLTIPAELWGHITHISVYLWGIILDGGMTEKEIKSLCCLSTFAWTFPATSAVHFLAFAFLAITFWSKECVITGIEGLMSSGYVTNVTGTLFRMTNTSCWTVRINILLASAHSTASWSSHLNMKIAQLVWLFWTNQIYMVWPILWLQEGMQCKRGRECKRWRLPHKHNKRGAYWEGALKKLPEFCAEVPVNWHAWWPIIGMACKSEGVVCAERLRPCRRLPAHECLKHEQQCAFPVWEEQTSFHLGCEGEVYWVQGR